MGIETNWDIKTNTYIEGLFHAHYCDIYFKTEVGTLLETLVGVKCGN